MEGWFSRDLVGSGVDVTVVVGLELDRGDVAEGAVDAGVVEPPHPVQGGEFEVVCSAPRALVVDAFGLVEPDSRLRQSVIVGLTGQSGAV